MDKDRKKQLLVLLGILTVAVISLVAIFALPYLDRAPRQQPVKLTLGVGSGILLAAVWVAEKKGYFAEQGIDLTIQKFDSGKLSFQALLAGSGPDIATVAPTPIMFKSMTRSDFAIFATFADSPDNVKIIARGDRRITAARDLQGKRVGTPSRTSAQFFFESFLTHNGMQVSDVHLVDIPPSELPGALEDGRVDAIAIWEPHGYNARQRLGEMAVIVPAADIYRETFNFMVMKAFTKARPEVLVRFLRAIGKATDYLNTHKEESQTIVAERLNLKRENVAAVWDNFRYELTLGQALLTTLEDEARWAIRSGLTEASEVPDYLDLIHFSAMDTVHPLAVDIVH